MGAGTVLDHETRTSYSVEVTATDPSGASDSITVTITVKDVDLGTAYDANNDEVISRPEVLAAIVDYLDGEIEKDEVLAVIRLYLWS